MKISVDRDRCEANGVCMGIAPEVFELDEDDELRITQPDAQPDTVERVTEAVDACPMNALRIADR